MFIFGACIYRIIRNKLRATCRAKVRKSASRVESCSDCHIYIDVTIQALCFQHCTTNTLNNNIKTSTSKALSPSSGSQLQGDSSHALSIYSLLVYSVVMCVIGGGILFC
ncbi:hypothetical protein Glove_54g161 [Diversispora epigaea]|uniref:Uncharacterized protein n=1 Tax=Diversispora epigaea TaxID=1348612 RepID=A0A397JLR1_9GLOM|nr:hypothetical protein Glove_54g161 [Diversispora epigaea]